MTIAIIITVAMSNILCFYIGLKAMQTVSKGKDLELPKISPTAIMQERAEKREAREKKEQMEKILANIDRYDGTPIGQQDV